jgi:hypothetical protein
LFSRTTHSLLLQRSVVPRYLLISPQLSTQLTRLQKKKKPVLPQPEPSAVQPAPQPRRPLVDDRRYGFCPSQSTQQVVTLPAPTQPSSRPSQVSSPAPSLSHLPRLPAPTQPSFHPLQVSSPSPSLSHLPCVSPPPQYFHAHLSNSSLPPSRSRTSSPLLPAVAEESDEDSDNEAEADNLEIDERSEEEDDRLAHAFLRTSPNQVPTVPTSQPLAPAVQVITTTAAPRPPPVSQGHPTFAVSQSYPT